MCNFKDITVNLGYCIGLFGINYLSHRIIDSFFADIKMKNYKMKTPSGQRPGLTQLFLLFKNIYLNIRWKLSVIQCYSWLFSMAENQRTLIGFEAILKKGLYSTISGTIKIHCLMLKFVGFSTHHLQILHLVDLSE